MAPTHGLLSQILREFADGRRRVVSDWRILIVARRLAQAANVALPNVAKARAIRAELERRGELAPVAGIPGVFLVESPYANLLEVSEEQLIQEGNPWAVFGFLTAMVHHGLTDLLPKALYAIEYEDREHRISVPFGTMPEDWADGIPRPSVKRPAQVEGKQVVWTEMKGDRGFGISVGFSAGLPIYITDVERTLLDGIRTPEKCGGIAKVFQAWRNGEEFDLGRLIEYTDRYDMQVLRQRVGFLVEKLGWSHPRLEEWRKNLQRGGSVKLLASGEYSGNYSLDWNLSLNVDPSVLAILE